MCVICVSRVETVRARLCLGAIRLRIRTIRRAGKSDVAVACIKAVGIADALAAHVTSGHAARVAAQATVSGPAATSGSATSTASTVPAAIATRCRQGRCGRKCYDAGGKPLCCLHFYLLKVHLNASIVRTARAGNPAHL